MEQITLGPTEVCISPMGIGTWAWGDQFFWGYGRGDYSDADLQLAFESTLQAGINFFDTAEVYGLGRSESLLGRYLQASDQSVVMATKFMPWPWRLNKYTLLDALRRSLERLHMPHVDLYQIHQPLPPVPVEVWMDALAMAVEAGLVRTVGVSNYNLERTRRAYDALAERGIPLASNQVEYSLIKRGIEDNGLLDFCRKKQITVIAYSPLGMGVLTGKYSAENPPPGVRGRRYDRTYLTRIADLLAEMERIGQAHGGRSAAQVALNWTIAKGTVPIPGAKNLRQAQSNAAALEWRLSETEVAALDQASASVQVRM